MGEDKAERIKDRLVVDKDKIFDKLLDQVEEILYLTDEGDIGLESEHKDLSSVDQIRAYLVGAWFASEAGLRESESLDSETLASKIGIDKKTVSARVSELKDRGEVESVSPGEYRVKSGRIESILDQLTEEI
jgi:hypothetical protein